MLCFAAALLAGVVAGNPAGTVLGRGLLILAIAYAVGRLLEATAARVLQPDLEAEETGGTGGTGGAVEEPAGAEPEASGPRTFPADGVAPARENEPAVERRRAA